MNPDWKVIYFGGFYSAYSGGVKALGSFWEVFGYMDLGSSLVESSLIDGRRATASEQCIDLFV